MADARMPDAFFNLVRPLLPPEKPIGSRGGRPPIPHPVALKVIWFVLVSGTRWQDVPAELGCSGRTAHRRLEAWEHLRVWDRIHLELLRLLRIIHRLDTHLAIIDSVQVRAFGGGERTGPSPVDRRKKGSKHTLMVDRHGVPLAIRTAGANASDHKQIIPLVLQFPQVGGTPGRPKELPDELVADAGYDSEATRRLLSWLGVEPKIRKSKGKHGSGLGKVRWVVERTISWLKGLRRLRIRYDRLGVIVDAWTSLAAAVICFRLWHEQVSFAR
jgi:transposase